jgi:DNA polymerase I
MVIDGNSLIYRAFYALPSDLATSSGQVTNAVYGFTAMLVNLLRDHKPDSMVVAFDRKEPTFRHKAIPEYKAQRDATPELLVPQFGLAREVLAVMNIPTVDSVGFEADDILATLATEARDRGEDVIVVTGDRDAYQLVEDPHIRVLYNKRGVSDYALYDEAGILERTGVTPEKYVMYAALRGDKSDNLAGVPGVGEKTAARLINKYGDIDGIYDHVDEQTPKLQQNLSENEHLARRNVDAMNLVRDVPDLPDVAGFSREPVDAEKLVELFDLLEFRTLYERLAEVLSDELQPIGTGGVLEAEVTQLSDPEIAASLQSLVESALPVAVAPTLGFDGEIEGLAVVRNAAEADVMYLSAATMMSPVVAPSFDTFLSQAPLAAHDAKPFLRALMKAGMPEPQLQMDTAIAAYLLSPGDARYSLRELLPLKAGFELPDDEPVGQLDLGDGSGVGPAKRACREALAVQVLSVAMEEAVEAQQTAAILHDMELPLVSVLARMEATGVGVDRAELERQAASLRVAVEELRGEIHELAGHEFNVNSTKQLRVVLFEELGLTPLKKTKTGYSTDATTLEKMRDQHPLVDKLLAYREVEKLRSTYGEGLLAAVAPDDRIHATFSQVASRTGRLSSEDPNLHNIPVRSERGREFRNAFIPGEGYQLLVADYNQIELRVIAHLCQDPGLIAAFTEGRDIHNATAAQVFGVQPDEVTTGMRSKAKMVSYGLAYGMEAYGLAQRLNIERDEAAEILDAYFEAFPSVKAFMAEMVETAKARGYSETETGRRRPLPDLNSPNFRVRQAAERQAMNAPIQGLAADIFKVALVRLDAALEDSDTTARLILQVHDEVILEVPPAEMDEITQLTLDTLIGAADLSVPLEVHVASGDSWATAKG